MLRRIALGVVAVLAAFALVLAWWLLRPNRAEVDPRLGLEHWLLVADGEHNSNTDLVHWRGAFWLVHAASPYHMGTPRSRLVLRRCADAAPGPASRFEVTAELRVPGKDIRDPKLIAVGDRLFLYALSNEGFYAVPSGTVLATSDDGTRWSEFAPVGPPGWLFWRPKLLPGSDGGVLYVTAYWKDHGESILLRSEDGLAWERVGTVHRGEGNDETELEFVPAPLGAGAPRMLATARLEVTPDRLLGNPDASTLLALADPPFSDWPDSEKRRDQTTRLDGPVLFSDRGRIFAVARHQAGTRGPLTRLGGAWSRKRTAIYLIDLAGDGARLLRLSDLPSAGDTAYAGAVLRNGSLYVDWYSSRIDRDYPWLLGMLLATDIHMARIPLDALHRLADARLAEAAASDSDR